MRHRVLVSVRAVAVLVALASSGAAPAAAQPSVPRTPWGAPDLQGVWDFRTITPLERPDEFAGKEVLTAEEAAAFERRTTEIRSRPNPETLEECSEEFQFCAEAPLAYEFRIWFDQGTAVVGSRRTSLVVDPPDGRLPPLTAAAQQKAEARRAYRRAHPADSWEDRSVVDRCIVGLSSLPMTPTTYNNSVQLFQTPDHVVIFNEMVHNARIVPLDGRPHTALRQWTGESRGRWDDETLVVETTNFTDKTQFHRSTGQLQLVERFTRVNAGTLMYEFTMHDPVTWTAPWTARIPMTKTEVPLYEYACHEGNYAMEGILAGHRADERAAAEPTRGSR